MFLKRDYRDRALGILGAFGLLAVALLVNGMHEASAKPVASVTAADALHAVNLTHEVDCPRCDIVC